MDTQHFKLGRAIEFWMSQGYRQEEEEDKKGRRDCNNSFLMKKEFLDDTKTGRLWQPWACENVLEICALIFTQQKPLTLVFRCRVTSFWGQDLRGG